jgi:hypothetical protein
MACTICQIRRPRRYCPGVQGEICALCCGTEREVTVNCPFDCEFLEESRKRDKPMPLDLEDLPNRDVHVSEKALEENKALVAFLSHSLVQAALSVPGIVDADARESLEALIRTWRTLASGLYYESLPQNQMALHLYRGVERSLEDLRRQEAQAGRSRTRDSAVLLVLVFLQRLELDRNNGRLRGRAFLNLLWDFYGTPPEEAPSSSLILL